MTVDFFEKIFKNLNISIIVCENTDRYPLVYANTGARLLYNPLLAVDKLKPTGGNKEYFDDLMVFRKKETEDTFWSLLGSGGTLTGYKAALLTADKESVTVYLSANIISEGGKDYSVIYINEDDDGILSSGNDDNALAAALNAVHQASDESDTVDEVLKVACTHVGLSSVYVIEEVSPTETKKSYEWSGESVQPGDGNLNTLPKTDSYYDDIVENEVSVYDNIQELPDMYRSVLEANGAKSMVTATLYASGKPIGYMGFEDINYRKWNKAEIRLLRGIANLVESLMLRSTSQNQTQLDFTKLESLIDGQHYLRTAAEIINRKEYEKQLEYYATTDTLTGAHNREWGYQAIANNILNPPRNSNKSSSLVFIDIDNFKRTNDEYGYEAGDNMLIETANTIRSAIRKTDLLFRWGADEFILILSSVGDDAENVMAKVQDSVDSFNTKYNPPVELSFSYGITDFDPGSTDDIDTLIKRADKLMRENKARKSGITGSNPTA